MGITEVVRARAVVVGSGIAGLTAALGLHDCVVVTRGSLGSGSSRMAQGGIAAALGRTDDAGLHAADTLAVAGGIGDSVVTAAVTAAAAGRVRWLQSLGAHFDQDATGSLRLGQEAGHSRRRIVHAQGDATGAEAMRTLTAAVRRRRDIEVLEQHALVDLLRQGERVVGVLAQRNDGALVAVLAPAVVLATGGIGGLYACTTNPPDVAGDGLAAAARAGALLADLEFVQFHPTALDIEAMPVPLLSEALRGEGATIIDERGTAFLRAIHPDAELAPRDVVARAIWQVRRDGQRAYLDATKTIGAAFPERFPTIWRIAQAAGFDPRVEPLPITPAEHYHMGGIATDTEGRSSLAGLWAVGEVAATGLHGANRLASNSLLEGLVFGARASAAIAAEPGVSRIGPLRAPRLGLEVGPEAPGSAILVSALREVMWNDVGLVRDEAGLLRALAQFRRMRRRARTTAVRNGVLVAERIAHAALARRESRGAHYRLDHPMADPALATRSFVRCRRAASIELRLLPKPGHEEASTTPRPLALRQR